MLHLTYDTHFTGVTEPELWFSIANTEANGTYSIMGSNYRFLMSKYGMNENSANRSCNVKCMNESDVIGTGVQIREVCE